MPFKVTSFNVKGLNSPNKRHSIWSEAIKLQCDLLCLQETHLPAIMPHPSLTSIFFTYTLPTQLRRRKGILLLLMTLYPSNHLMSPSINRVCSLFWCAKLTKLFTTLSTYTVCTQNETNLVSPQAPEEDPKEGKGERVAMWRL